VKKKSTPPAADAAELARIRRAFAQAGEIAGRAGARRERHVENILRDDIPTFMELPLATKAGQLAGADAVIVGMPYEGITIKTPSLSAPANVTPPPPGSIYWRMGADQAPAAIRRLSLFYSVHHNRGWYPEIDSDLLIANELKMFDYGDIEVDPADTDETMRRAEARVHDIVAAGAMPITLGGDHTIPIPVLRAILKERESRIGVISFDGHMDLSVTDEVWASVEWTKTFELGKLRPRNLVEIGIRSNRSTLYEKTLADLLGVKVFTIDEVKRLGMERVIAEAIEIASDGTDGIYVSMDIDAMEPALVPAQKAPEIWGLTIDEMMVAMRALRAPNVIGFDICELSPAYDVNGISAQFCARMVVEVLAGLAQRKKAAR
jgi:arginase family enzyme